MRRDAIDALNERGAFCSKIRNINSLGFSSWEATKRTLYSNFAVRVGCRIFWTFGCFSCFSGFLVIANQVRRGVACQVALGKNRLDAAVLSETFEAEMTS